MTTVPKCNHCGKSKSVKLRRQFAGNGAQQFTWYCLDCDKVANNQSPWIKKSLIEQWIKSGRLPSIESIPVIHDYRENHSCEVCHAIGAEYHHWFPQCFYDDISDHNDWPGSYLCKDCHDKWHEIVTWYLPGRIGTERSNVIKARYFPNGRNIQD